MLDMNSGKRKKEGDASKPSKLSKKTLDANDLPAEIISHIMSFLPSYQLIGKDGKSRVSKKWLAASRSHTNSGMISCQTPEDALQIVSDETILNQLSWNQLLQIITKNNEMALYMIQTAEISQWLSNEDVTILCENAEVLKIVIQEEHLTRKLFEDKSLIKRFLIKNPKALTFQCVYDRTRVGQAINIRLLVDICKENPEFAIDGIQHLFEFSKNECVEVCKKHEKAATILLYKFFSSLSTDQIYSLCVAHPSLIYVFGSEQRALRLTPQQIIQLGCKSQDFAFMVLRSAPLLKKISNEAIIQWARLYPVISQMLSLKRDCTFNNNQLALLGDPIISKHFFEKELTRAELTGEALASIGRCNHEHAVVILSTENLVKKLSDDQLIYMVEKHPELMLELLNNPKFNSLLKGNILQRLGELNIEAAKIIVLREDLNSKLNSSRLAAIGKAHYAIADMIVHSENLAKKLDDLALSELVTARPALCTIILDIDFLKATIDLQTLKRLVLDQACEKRIGQDAHWLDFIVYSIHNEMIDFNFETLADDSTRRFARLIANSVKHRDQLSISNKVRVATQSVEYAKALLCSEEVTQVDPADTLSYELASLVVYGHPLNAKTVLTEDSLNCRLLGHHIFEFASKFLGFAKRINHSRLLFENGFTDNLEQDQSNMVQLKKIDIVVPKLQRFCQTLIERNNASKMRVG